MRVHLASISTLHPPGERFSIFFHSLVSWLKGLLNVYPPVSIWDLSLVLYKLIWPTPLNLWLQLHYLYYLRRQCFWWQSLLCKVFRTSSSLVESPFTIFQKDTVVCRLHSKFMPKVMSVFHLNQTINLHSSILPKLKTVFILWHSIWTELGLSEPLPVFL